MNENKLLLNIDEGYGFMPPCYKALMSYSEISYHEEFDLPHPIAIFNHSWSAVCYKLITTIDALEIMQSSFNDRPNGSNSVSLLAAYEALLHTCDEFIENIEKNITKSFAGKNGKADISGPDSLRKFFSIPCNRIKHNHNRLVYFELNNTRFKVSCCSLYHIHKGGLRPNPEIHKNNHGFSFNMQLRKVVSSLYFYTDTVEKKIIKLSNSPIIPEIHPDTNTISMLKRISKLPIISMPHETNRDIPSIDFNEKKLELSLRGGNAIPINGRATVIHVGDGYTHRFAVPGYRKE